jgi:cation:H+ antiporter
VSAAVEGPLFVVAGGVALSASWVVVSRLERVGEHLGLSEALLGLVAALAADGPEITSAVTALVHHQPKVGAGVVLGSCPFNLAALLGLGAVLAGRITLHRRVILLGGTVAMAIAIIGLLAVRADVVPGAGLAIAAAILFSYIVILGSGLKGRRLPGPARAALWLQAAAAEEEAEMEAGVLPEPGTRAGLDTGIMVAALMIVIAASVVMERSAASVGHSLSVPDIVVGALVLGGATSLPNAVSAIYLVRRGRGAASLSTSLNSNNFNVTVGLLIPATVVGLGPPSGQSELVAAWCAGLTAVTLALAYRGRGLNRISGVVIIAGYLVFAGSVIASS